ncbi:nucleotide disphospho-sugar-binding domain-containing protein [Saccharopolyspora sp. NPDC050642]|uniref:glycosyltransferase n=1 Tax=Saccharopolyspora sp. NPDC050642 TaxID=3157099 RepID=UPI00340C8CB8
MQAAVEAGHTVALATSAGVRDEVGPELAAEVAFLAAGAMPMEFSEDAARRTGADPFHPGPELIGEIFGGSRVDLGGGETIGLGREWAPDLIVAEMFDAIGPMVAADLGIPWYQVGIGPATHAVITEIERAAASRYRDAGLDPVGPLSYIDPCPPQLQDPDWSSRVPVLPLRTQAHRRPRDMAFEPPAFADPAKPTVLVTLGTIFSDPDVLDTTVRAMAGHDVNVIATVGSSMRNPAAGDDGSRPSRRPDGVEVHFVPFVPLGQLLDRADLVVGAGGSGTVLGALAHGLPMVLWPQGADQPINAARAAAAGAAITVDSGDEIFPAVRRALGEGTFRDRAQAAAAENDARPSPADVIKEIAQGPVAG